MWRREEMGSGPVSAMEEVWMIWEVETEDGLDGKMS